jgi:hypothetical protein
VFADQAGFETPRGVAHAREVATIDGVGRAEPEPNAVQAQGIPGTR